MKNLKPNPKYQKYQNMRKRYISNPIERSACFKTLAHKKIQGGIPSIGVNTLGDAEKIIWNVAMSTILAKVTWKFTI